MKATAKSKGKRTLAAVLTSNVHILGQPKPRIINPVHDWHVLKEIPGPAKTPGGLVVPENQRSAEAIVVASGPGRMNGAGIVEPMVAKPGQQVVFEGQTRPFCIDGETYYCVRDVQLVGIVEKPPSESNGGLS